MIKCAQILMKGNKHDGYCLGKKSSAPPKLINDHCCSDRWGRAWTEPQHRASVALVLPMWEVLSCVKSTWKAQESDSVSWHGATGRIQDLHLVWGAGTHDHGLGNHPSHLGRLQVAHQDGHAVLHLHRERERTSRKHFAAAVPGPVFDFMESNQRGQIQCSS